MMIVINDERSETRAGQAADVAISVIASLARSKLTYSYSSKEHRIYMEFGTCSSDELEHLLSLKFFGDNMIEEWPTKYGENEVTALTWANSTIFNILHDVSHDQCLKRIGIFEHKTTNSGY